MAVRIRALQFLHQQWREQNFPDQQPHQALLGLAEEVGELAHAHLKGEQGIRGMVGEVNQKAKEDAVGDIFIYLMSYCSTNGIDLESCILETWGRVSKRDWRSNPETGEALEH